MSGEHRSEARPDIESAIQELRKDVGDIATSAAGLGYEVQALVTLGRHYVKHVTGDDPLEGTLYAGDDDEDPGPEPPGWVARTSGASLEAPSPASPARGDGEVARRRVGCLVLVALFAALLVGLYVLGRLVS